MKLNMNITYDFTTYFGIYCDKYIVNELFTMFFLSVFYYLSLTFIEPNYRPI